DQPHLQQLRGAVDLLVGHQLLGRLRRDALAQQAHRAAAREQAEHDLGKAEAALLLGDDVVGRERQLEAAAQRPSLYQRDGGHPALELGRPGDDRVEAAHRVLAQALHVAAPDALQEEAQVAALAEVVRVAGLDPRVRRRVADGAGDGVRDPQLVDQFVELVHQRGREVVDARGIGRDVDPQRPFGQLADLGADASGGGTVGGQGVVHGSSPCGRGGDCRGVLEITSAALVPPKPQENDSACGIGMARGAGPTWLTAQASSGSPRWALAGATPIRIASRVSTNSSALAPPSRWPWTDLVDETAASPGPAPNTSRIELASISSPPRVAVAWALT